MRTALGTVLVSVLGLVALGGATAAAQAAPPQAAPPQAAPPLRQTPLRQTPFGDGTGSIGLPAGWQIRSASRGSITCVGPDGAAVILGLPWMVMRPTASFDGPPTDARQPTAEPGDVVGALREVLRTQVGARLTSVRGNRVPGWTPSVPAYYLLYEFEQDGQPMAGLGYFTALDYGPDIPAWQLYSSAVVAPRARFPQVVQTMLGVWQSWRPNGQAPTEGSGSALFDRLLRERQLTFDRISRAFRDQM